MFWVLYWTVSVYLCVKMHPKDHKKESRRNRNQSYTKKTKKKSNLSYRTAEYTGPKKLSYNRCCCTLYSNTHVALSNTDIQRYVQAGQQWLLKSLSSPHYAFRERNTPNPAEESPRRIEFKKQLIFFFSFENSLPIWPLPTSDSFLELDFPPS